MRRFRQLLLLAIPCSSPIALFTATPALAQAAVAQNPASSNPEEGQTIVVTGSITRNPATATASPVVSITKEDLAKRGINTVTDAIISTAANNAGSMASSWSAQGGFATGASAPSLRGLNDAYTLTLFDGMRTAVYPLADDGYRNFVDLNTIPESIVDRIDVLQDGASSTYGSDAVAGVVNVKIKHEIRGFHANASQGLSQRNDGGETRVDGTWGIGSLKANGYNFYINGEYQKNKALFLRDRGYPFNTADQSRVCTNGGSLCRTNFVANGVQANGNYNGFNDTIVGFARPYDAVGQAETGQYTLLNPPAGCGRLNSYALTAGNVANLDPTTAASLPAVVCQQDYTHDYTQYSPNIERIGANTRLTKEVGDHAEAYVMANFLQTRTSQIGAPQNFSGQTANGGTVETLSPLLLPVYVCPQGMGNLDPSQTGCDATNGVLNPNNPFASSGQFASLHEVMVRPLQALTRARSLRLSTGIAGSFGDHWNYSLDAVTSSVRLRETQRNAINAQHLLNLIATGRYNFVDQGANSPETSNYLTPPSIVNSISKLTQVQGTLDHDFFRLPGGALNVAVGLAYRFEAIHNPSANPANEANPFDRYYVINAVGVDGARRIRSAFYEITAPLLPMLKLKADGRYDKYSSGQKNFSPKFEAEFKPNSVIKVRGTYSRGFRVASFNQAYGLPTTGFITVSQFDCATYASFCAAHASNPTYFRNGYSYGLTAVGNPNLAPEKSRSFTFGTVLTPLHNFNFTVDYWNIRLSNIIVSNTGAQTQQVLNQYFTNNGVVNVPGVLAVVKGVPDTVNPTALPLIQSFETSYSNANSEVARGIDFGASGRFNLSPNLRLTSQATASLLLRLALNNAGKIERYDGTLGPCNITSCSGAPKLRATWSNTLELRDRGSVTLTTNYTSGYSEVATDFGGVYGNCAASLGAAVATYSDAATPVICRAHPTLTFDMDTRVNLKKNVTVYFDVRNLLNSKPIYDPGAAYGITQFNPAWNDSNFVGRFFRLGVSVDF